MADLAALIRDIPDFPSPGILFKDITTLLKDPEGLRQSIDQLTEQVRDFKPTKVVGMESRGFIFAVPIAYNLNVGFAPVRKVGKLPHETINLEYSLEYGTATLEIHRDAIQPGDRILVVDDLLATGGTVGATLGLVEQLGGEVCGVAFLVELSFLNGRSKLDNYPVVSLITY